MKYIFLILSLLLLVSTASAVSNMSLGVVNMNISNATYLNQWVGQSNENFVMAWLNTLTQPYTDLFGDWFYFLIYMAAVGAIWLRSNEPTLPFLALMLGALFFVVLFPPETYLPVILMAGGVAGIIFALTIIKGGEA